jgi:hypothetical protein
VQYLFDVRRVLANRVAKGGLMSELNVCLIYLSCVISADVWIQVALLATMRVYNVRLTRFAIAAHAATENLFACFCCAPNDACGQGSLLALYGSAAAPANMVICSRSAFVRANRLMTAQTLFGRCLQRL